MPTVTGPDFICIGMAKAGTSWLYDQLSGHPDFWMPRVKELQYLNHRAPKLANVEKHWRQAKRRKRGDDARQRAFLREAKNLIGRPMDIVGYATLFRHKGTQMSGDISPPYANLAESVIADIAERLPEVRVLFLVREPLERAWSNLCMSHRRGRFDPTLLEDPEKFQSYFQDQRLDDRLFPTRILERWKKNAPDIPFRHVLFDDIVSDAGSARRQILTFLGADPDKESGALAPEYNRKANAAKLTLNEPIKAILLEHFAGEIRVCADVFGGSAKNWVERYGL